MRDDMEQKLKLKSDLLIELLGMLEVLGVDWDISSANIVHLRLLREERLIS